ncbi:MAG: VWA domain-containing protein [Candidatus Binatia bacterium]
MNENRAQRPRKRGPVYPWLRRDYFKTSVSWLVSLSVHAVVLFFLLATLVMDGGGGPGTGVGGKGELISTLVGKGMLSTQTERTDDSKSLEEAIQKAASDVEPLPQVASQDVTPDLSDVGVRLSDVAPKINPMGTTSSLRSSGATGGGMAVGPGTGAGGGMGGGIGRGFGRGFGDFVGLMQKWGFDVVFVVDATNSMEFVIDTVKRRLTDLVGRIQKIVPNARVGIVVFKDKGDDFTVRMSSLSFHADKLQSFITSVKAGGGGDYEEAVYEGVRTAVEEMDWRQYANRAMVVVSSSPPKRNQIAALETTLRGFHEKGGAVHFVDLADAMHRAYETQLHRTLHGRDPDKITPLPQFLRENQELYRSFARLGGGELIEVKETTDLAENLMVAAFGPQWRKEVGRFSAGL